MSHPLLAALLFTFISCAAPSSAPPPRPVNPVLAPDAPLRVETRARIDAWDAARDRSVRQRGGESPMTSDELRALAAEGCLEATWCKFVYLPRGSLNTPSESLDELARNGLDHPWFAPRVAEMSLPLRTGQLTMGRVARHQLDLYGEGLERLLENTDVPSCRAALEAELGRLLVQAFIHEADHADQALRGARMIEEACIALGDEAALVIDAAVLLDDQDLVRRAKSLTAGVTLPPIDYLDAVSNSVDLENLRGGPTLIMVWSFT